KIVLAVQYLQKELPVRLAHAVQLFQHLPYIVAVNPHILEVMLVNLVTFDALRGLPPVETYEQAKHYAGFAMHAAQLHMNFLPTLVSGISAAKMLPSELGVSATELDLFMDDVVRQRLNRRVILAHIAALVEAFQKKTAHDEDWLGAFHGRCSPAEEIGHATEIVRELSMRRFGKCPEVRIEGDKDAVFKYLPGHLKYILFELLKNAVRHTVDWSMRQRTEQLPPVIVRICDSPDRLYIKIQDLGGGFGAEAVRHAWEWGGRKKFQIKDSLQLPETMDTGDAGDVDKTEELIRTKRGEMEAFIKSYSQTDKPPIGLTEWIFTEHGSDMGGLTTSRHGLPVARAYARYLGGDIAIETLHGVGSTVYVTLGGLDSGDRITF
ncbi:[Pyruvate dehydrogenase (acetyl-transferring)] kinase, partial [Diplonema papillatum]